MKFISWFKGSLEDEKGIASFRRIYNWILISLVAFVVIYNSVKGSWSMLLIYVLVVLLAAGFLNTSVITADNILRFFGRDKKTPDPQPQKAKIEGDIKITNQT